MNKAIFLDRDGVINKETNYLSKISDFEFVEGIFDICRLFIELNYKIFIITNQSGIARGLYNINDFNILTKWMLKEFKKKGIQISKVYYCPHHPKYSGECTCRKPKPGMILGAALEYSLNLSESILIGDKLSDIKAGEAAGIRTNILVQTNQLPTFLFKIKNQYSTIKIK